MKEEDFDTFVKENHELMKEIAKSLKETVMWLEIIKDYIVSVNSNLEKIEGNQL